MFCTPYYKNIIDNDLTKKRCTMKKMRMSKRSPFLGILLLALLIIMLSCSDSSTSPSTGSQGSTNCVLTSLPGPSGTTITVSTVAELVNAVQQANASGNLTILIEDGTYTLSEMLWIEGNNVTFRSRSGNRDAVVIRGQGMNGSVSHIFNVPGDNFTAADMTIGWVANHAIQIHSDGDNPVVHNVRFVDTYEQMLKVSFRPGDSTSSDNGLVEWCVFEYSAGIGPQYYIGGIDAHQAHNWTIRNNVFYHIRSPEAALAEYAIHFWSDASNTLVEHNTIINCDRGIGFGLGDRGHIGGMIRNNMVYTTRDVGISLENSRNTTMYNNTVYTENYGNSIEYRFSGTQGVSIINNLTNAQIASRDGGSGRVETNVTSARSSWFVDVGNGNLRLTTAESAVVDQGQTLADVTQDIDCEMRPKGAAYDIGADEL
jgi:parallel beta-helix repeat protein